MSKIRRILEKHGFTVEGSKGNWTIQQYTPEGEDWNICLTNLSEITEYAENYSPEEDFDMWWNARNSVAGVPKSPSDLWKDQLWKQEKLKAVADEINA